MNETPVYQIVFLKKDTAHVFNIAKMDVISSHNASHDIVQLLTFTSNGRELVSYKKAENLTIF